MYLNHTSPLTWAEFLKHSSLATPLSLVCNAYMAWGYIQSLEPGQPTKGHIAENDSLSSVAQNSMVPCGPLEYLCNPCWNVAWFGFEQEPQLFMSAGSLPWPESTVLQKWL